MRILAIAAVKLGARGAIAVDIDPQAGRIMADEVKMDDLLEGLGERYLAEAVFLIVRGGVVYHEVYQGTILEMGLDVSPFVVGYA